MPEQYLQYPGPAGAAGSTYGQAVDLVKPIGQQLGHPQFHRARAGTDNTRTR